MAAVKRIKKVHHITANPSPNSNFSGTSKPIPARKMLRPSIGYSYVISSPISELKTRYAPTGNDNIIKQKITVIKAVCGIASACKILFCDEPTSGLDPIRSRDISDLIKKVTMRMKCTTVITSHDMRNAFRIADKAALMREGRIIAYGQEEDFNGSDDPYVKEFLS